MSILYHANGHPDQSCQSLPDFPFRPEGTCLAVHEIDGVQLFSAVFVCFRLFTVSHVDPARVEDI